MKTIHCPFCGKPTEAVIEEVWVRADPENGGDSIVRNELMTGCAYCEYKIPLKPNQFNERPVEKELARLMFIEIWWFTTDDRKQKDEPLYVKANRFGFPIPKEEGKQGGVFDAMFITLKKYGYIEQKEDDPLLWRLT